MPQGDQNSVPSGIIGHFINEPAGDQNPKPAVTKPELLTDFKVADRILFLSSVRQIVPVKTDTLIGHCQVQASIVGSESDVDGFGCVAVVSPFDCILTKFKNSLTQSPGFCGHPRHEPNAVENPC